MHACCALQEIESFADSFVLHMHRCSLQAHFGRRASLHAHSTLHAPRLPACAATLGLYQVFKLQRLASAVVSLAVEAAKVRHSMVRPDTQDLH